ncbi:hypothetical protein H6504_03225 [Candidatus Woesearchaeota archaeon]|nr:hypothetical protein [Candidatus Woesearchaeota archaeon]
MSVPPQLIDYIRTYLSQGYTEQQLRPYLIQNGWTPSSVDEAFSIIFNRQVPVQTEHTIHIKGMGIIMGVLVVVIGLVGLLIYLLLPSAEPAQEMLLDYQIKISPAEKIKFPGEELAFETTLVNMGKTPRYDVVIEYSFSSSGGKTVETWDETKAIETVHPYTVRKVLPVTLAPGNYVLKGHIAYGDGLIARASDSFVVKNRESTTAPTCTDGILNQGEEETDCGGPCNACEKSCFDCDDTNMCTRDVCKEGVCTHIPITPCCGDNICSEGEVCIADCPSTKEPTIKVTATSIKEEAMDIASTDEESAGKYCNTLEKEVDKDYCFRVVAHGTENKNFCKFIISSSTKDFCYMKFATKGDNSVCPEISNEHLQRACISLGT